MAPDICPIGRKRRILRRALGVLLVLALVVLAVVWWQRERIASDFIADALDEAGVAATYDVESIGPRRQVLRNIVIGDPAQPDLTVDRFELNLLLRFGMPSIRDVRVSGVRLYGTLRDGQPSFGALDPLLFTGEDTPFELPDLQVAIDDGRALIESDYGRIGLSLSGAGHLRDGFTGELAAIVPTVEAGACTAGRTTLYGTVAIDAERPSFSGPVRFDGLSCPDSQLALAAGTAQVDVLGDRGLEGFEGRLVLRGGAGELAGSRAEALAGEAAFTWREDALTASYELDADDVATPWVRLNRLALEGSARAADGFARMEIAGEARGAGLRFGGDLDAQLASGARAVEGTLLAPLLAQVRSALGRELPGSSFVTNFTLRRTGELLTMLVPQGNLRGASGATLLALSRGRFSRAWDELPRFEGNFATGGAGLPRIGGRMEQAGTDPLALRLRMTEYAVGESRLAVPELSLARAQGGEFSITGQVLASGPLPGGFARGLVLPVDGTVGADGSLALWQGCREVRFDSLELANLTLGRQSLTLCPQRGAPILRYGAGGLQLAAGADALNLRGELGGTPVVLASGPVGFAWPGALAARDIAVTLGPEATASRFVISDLAANLSARDIGGTFTGADVFLASVPLDLLGATGDWRYAGGRLELSGGTMMLEDREAVDRFHPLAVRGATLALADSRITANGMLHEPRTGAQVARVDIAHDLTTAAGFADLSVPQIVFTPDGLQPRDLSELAYGVISVVEGSVTGSGRIDWNAEAITSTGAFSSDSLDFAAAFGPVTGASGTVTFTDLIGMTTAPDQRIALAAINPGIEITDGEIVFELVEGRLIRVDGGTWPFLGGTLRLRPVTLNIGMEETRSYVLEIEGLEAGRFIERMELNNIAASGTFDGTIPIVFDAAGNGQLIGGMIISRPPGGHLSYVGQLTYEDLSYAGDLAFNALRDLRYNRAEILLDGPLTGELVTRVRFDGISQGATAESNFITRRLAQLPIRLLINIRAPFYQLIATTRSIYDPSAVRDPRTLGLLTDDGTRLRGAVDQEAVDALDAAAAEAAEAEASRAAPAAAPADADDSDIQPPESEALP